VLEPDASAPAERRLAAILCADLRGYSRLMAQDEAATLRMLARFRRLAEQVIRRHGGRVANTAGDSLLVEFASATDALRGALDIQSRIAGANEDVRPDRRAQ
jgi:adenylate cyclase